VDVYIEWMKGDALAPDYITPQFKDKICLRKFSYCTDPSRTVVVGAVMGIISLIVCSSLMDRVPSYQKASFFTKYQGARRVLEFFTGIFIGIKGIQFVMEDLTRDMITGRSLEFDQYLAGFVGLCAVQFLLATVDAIISRNIRDWDDMLLNLLGTVTAYMAIQTSQGSVIAAYIMSAFIATPFYQTHAIVLSSALLAEDDDVREVAAVLKVVGVLIRTVIMANFAGWILKSLKEIQAWPEPNSTAMLAVLGLLAVATLQWLREGWAGLDAFGKRQGSNVAAAAVGSAATVGRAATAAPQAATKEKEAGAEKGSHKKGKKKSKKEAAKEKKTN